MTTLPSPCVNICKLNPHGICVGCGRTMSEIEVWPLADEVLKRAICERAERRRSQLSAETKSAR